MLPWSVIATAAHAELFGPLGELSDAQRAVEKRVLRVDVEVNELGGHRSRFIPSRLRGGARF